MPSAYLQPADYATYGLAQAGSAQDVQRASSLIDMFLKRPEGLVWVPDATGQPCYMAAMNPGLTLTLGAPLAPGANVVVPLVGPAGMLQVGDVLVCDRAASPEALVVAAVSGQSATFKSVAGAHVQGATLDTNLVVTEQRFMPKLRPITTLSRNPVVRIVSGTGRYGYPRRGEAAGTSIDDFNLLASLSKFGGPPVWELFDPAATDVDPRTGQCWIPAGIMLAYYTEVKVRYVAGFSQAGLPEQVKQACADLVRTIQDAPDLGAVKSYRAGDTQIERFADTMISGDTRAALLPFQVRAFA